MQRYEELLVSIRQVIRAIDLYSKKLNKETGLTSSQLLVLQDIRQHEGTMVKDIANRITLSSATVTSILDRLEVRALVVRQRSENDRRRVGLFLTETGSATIEDAPTLLQEHFINRFESMEQWEQSQMVATMQRIASMMDAERIDASPVLEVGQLRVDPIAPK
ncbi:MarR family transcriptional regulator [uncultured Umboniibacter sp.]|uniref:MarR family winged helix-turn-helix transcriptional regulator n=1 Tax=uncultured Umboniibacter sp. TaxID=1798917 RepID=UPI0026212B0C|nr:MarR family transcriptional regulator [uncultured Umboniibacter sp.]